ncbi:hypothetical protein VNO78_03472 [Psophocarpus tetragonolobus]|uniref:Uncharacterized protein n=1 Tax=Psophocarpus tetragonolobus TaxID=3891 RepID=A0AAN9T0L3_PSOTE
MCVRIFVTHFYKIFLILLSQEPLYPMEHQEQQRKLTILKGLTVFRNKQFLCMGLFTGIGNLLAKEAFPDNTQFRCMGIAHSNWEFDSIKRLPD